MRYWPGAVVSGRAARGSPADDRGMAAVEAAIVAPVLIAFLLLVVFVARVAEAEGNVRRAASEAARAASLRQHAGDAVDAAQATVEANLSAAGVSCEALTVDVDTGHFTAGGRVTVTVTCVASMSDVTLLGVPGARTFTAREVEVIDRYRGTGADESGLLDKRSDSSNPRAEAV
jgi:Flp pilus assembly protein TadG